MITRGRIFLAHAREDKAQVRKLYDDLKARGLDPWLDEVDLMPGQIWKTEIWNAIREAGVFLACLSSRSVGKVGYVQNEFRLALSAFWERPPGWIYIIPVRLDECAVPDLRIPDRGLSLRDIQWVDLWEDGSFDRLVKAIKDALVSAHTQQLTRASADPAQVASQQQALGAILSSGTLKQPGTVFRDINAPWCPEMVVIPAGSFVMGSPETEDGRSLDEGPQHDVRFAKPFALGRYPVTFEEYDHFCAETKREKPPDQGWGRGRRPAINVSWEDAKAYVAWLSKITGEPYRLPSEPEWEYSARAGSEAAYWWGDEGPTPEQANFGRYVGRTTEVGSYPANPWGLHDTAGNVWEWCEDCWNGSYQGALTDGSAWLKGDCSRRVMRGGSWDSEPWVLRSASRFWIAPEPDSRLRILGFRVSRTLTP